MIVIVTEFIPLLLCQYSFQGFMIVIVTEFIPLLQLSIVLMVILWESCRWFGRIFCGVLVKRNPGTPVDRCAGC